MKVLITGASGFIGGRLALSLSENADYQVSVTGRSSALSEKFLASKVNVIQGDLLDMAVVEKAIKSIDIVIHCAGLAGTWGTYDDFYQANVAVTANLIKAAQASQVKRIINISSPSIYVNFSNQLLIKESYLPETFSNFYAQTKFEADQLMNNAHSDALQTISLRPRLVIGKGDTTLLPRLLALQSAGLLKQIGSGQNVVDFTSIDNLIELIEHCFTVPNSAMGRAYNVSNGQADKLWDVIDEVCRQMNIPIKRQKVPYRPVMALAKLNEKIYNLFKLNSEPKLLPVPVSVMANSMTLNIDDAREFLSYSPKITTKHSISEFVAWWKENNNL